MIIDDEAALRDWLIATLEPLCDAEPEALTRYVLALISKDKPVDKLRENCIDRLDVFLCGDTTNFVDQLFEVIRTRQYLPEGKKENVQPEISKPAPEVSTTPIESHPIPTTTSAVVQPGKRRHSSRSNSPGSSSPKRGTVPEASFDQQYNPELPDLNYDPYQPSSFMPNPQRTLVTVVTNAESLTTDKRRRYPTEDHRGGAGRTKRHVTTAPYPPNGNRKRPWQKANGSGSTLEIRKIPPEFNTISKLNEHFSKFGTVTNVQIAYDGAQDSALIAYGTFQEAETAYKNPEPLFNNRFIKIFWHKGSSTPNNAPPPPPPPPAEVRPPKKPLVIPHPTKLHWSKNAKTDESLVARPKKKPSHPAGPSSIKKEAAKKASIEIRRKKSGLLDEQIQQQKLLLKKLESAETNEEKESIRSLMKQIDATVTLLKDSLRTATPTPAPPSQQDLLKQRAKILQKQLENLRAKTSADMRRSITTTLGTKIPDKETSTGGDPLEES